MAKIEGISNEYHGISVHFSDSYNDYYTAYKYVTKMDVEALHSESHPDLKSAAAPRTERAIGTWRRSSMQKRDYAQTESANLSRSLASLKTTEKPLKRCRLTAHRDQE